MGTATGSSSYRRVSPLACEILKCAPLFVLIYLYIRVRNRYLLAPLDRDNLFPIAMMVKPTF